MKLKFPSPAITKKAPRCQPDSRKVEEFEYRSINFMAKLNFLIWIASPLVLLRKSAISTCKNKSVSGREGDRRSYTNMLCIMNHFYRQSFIAHFYKLTQNKFTHSLKEQSSLKATTLVLRKSITISRSMTECRREFVCLLKLYFTSSWISLTFSLFPLACVSGVRML